MIRIRKLCILCGRHYVFHAEGGHITDQDPGCPDCHPENHEQIVLHDE